jgi:hypothetical protein
MTALLAAAVTIGLAAMIVICVTSAVTGQN